MGDPALILFVTGNPALGEAELLTGSIQLEEAEASAERRQSRVLAMLDVPSRFVPTDVIELLAPFHESIRAIRLLRHCEPPRWLPDHYIALLELVSVAAAEALFAANQNRPFNSFEDDKCCLRFVARGGVVLDRNRRRSNSGVGVSLSPHTRCARHATSSQASSSPVASPPVARSPLADDAAAHARAAAAAIDSAADGFETASAATAGAGGVEPAAESAARGSPSAGHPRVGSPTLSPSAASVHSPTQRSSPLAPLQALAPVDPAVCPALARAATAGSGADGADGAADGADGEDATCVVCLERMGPADGVPRVLTTACNHSFHLECLSGWHDAPCPVCRYHHSR